MVNIGNSWDEILKDEWSKPYYIKLREFLKYEYSHYEIYPDMNNIFNALKLTSFENIRACIIGQDPYHEPMQAHGLCFSVQGETPLPPSLQNIYKEINSELGLPVPTKGDLTKWAKSGVLMLNACLTVRRGQANSHQNMGWEIFTDKVISELNKKETPVVFLLWGANAKKKAELITNPLHYKLFAAHPSPLSAYRGFFGCGHFAKCNEILIQNGLEPIDWSI